ncbi:MAG: PAS domain-containing protein [Anaerolineales bacterium]|nr:PAS domain-containing protein [Anaerolineales bacterium]MCB8951799.1 PAS domain-containing protein [Ardenticatenales bacterium]
MNWHYTPHSLLLFTIAGALILLGLYAQQWRDNNETRYFTLLGLAASWWAVTYGLELSATGLSAKLFWARLEYVGIAATPLAWLLLVLRHTNHEDWLRRRNVVVLTIVPALTILLAFTNNWHYLLWRTNELSPDGILLANTYGPWFWFHVLVSYSYVFIGSSLLLRVIWRNLVKMFQLQAFILFSGLMIPWIGNILYIFRIVRLDPTPFAFGISTFLLSIGLYRFRLLDIVPIARGSVINSMNDGMIVFDHHQRVLDLNQAARTIFNWREENSFGQMLPDELRHQLPPLTENGTPEAFVTELRLRQGNTTYGYEARLSPVMDRVQQHQGYLLLLHDITERQRLQQLREDLTSTIVHDLRTPLGAIHTTLTWLEETTAAQMTEANQEILHVARHSAEQMLLLVSSILDINRIESGMMPIHYSSFTLQEMADGLLKRYAVIAHEKKLRLVREIAGISPAYADRELIERVLQNLLGNAIKFTPYGGYVRISAQPLAADPQKLLVAVHDNGPGIPPEQQTTLFQKFSTGNAVGQGSGLGLAFCKMAVEAHHERIWVESERGQGTTVFLTLRTQNQA